ncbi:MAG: outer membrane lipoprotein-sorting protein [Candidatus Riflebacteria bacterium]|nr:outer membrane lipoprotein-sorting protein [Candidatus Riflebacteria bacterium]
MNCKPLHFFFFTFPAFSIFLFFFQMISVPAVFCQLPANQTSIETDEELRALIKKIETQHRGETSHSISQMNISTKEWKRTLKMENWSEGRDKFLVRILEPAKEKGTCTLKVNSDIWNFLPKIDRLMKIPSSLMGDKWMGSHFTNDDLVKEDKIDILYDFRLEKKDEKFLFVQAIPKSGVAVVWGKLLYTIDREKEVPKTIEYFDEAGVKVRVITFDRVSKISNRWVAQYMKVEPIENSGEYTEMIFDNLEFDIKLPSNLFSVQTLRKSF